jgi:apolipoprotein N-acyltransferase
MSTRTFWSLLAVLTAVVAALLAVGALTAWLARDAGAFIGMVPVALMVAVGGAAGLVGATIVLGEKDH